MLDDLEALADGRFTLAGYSMGGRLALHYAVVRPARVERLVLLGASPGIADRVEREDRRRADERLAAEIERSSIEEFASRWETTPLLAGQPAGVLESVSRGPFAEHAGRARACAARIGSRCAGPALGPALRSDDAGDPGRGRARPEVPGIAEKMAVEIPEAEVVVVRGAGHAVHLEAPRRVAEIVGGEPRLGGAEAR